MDQVAISIANIREMNPLAEVSVVLDLKQIKQHPQIEFEDDGITVKINEEMVI